MTSGLLIILCGLLFFVLRLDLQKLLGIESIEKKIREKEIVQINTNDH